MPRDSGHPVRRAGAAGLHLFQSKRSWLLDRPLSGDDALRFLARTARQRGDIDLFAWRLVALDLEEREGARWLGALAWAQRAERLVDLGALVVAVDRDQHADRVLTQRRREGDLVGGGGARLIEARRIKT